MTYDEKPWLKWYDPEVGHEVVIPELTIPEQYEKIAGQFAAHPAVHFYGVTLTYEELIGHGYRFAAALAAHECGPGDVVAISLPNVPQYLIAQIGSLEAGCATTGLSPLLTPREIAYQLNDCRAKALVTLDAIFEHRLAGIAHELPHLKLVVVTGVLDFLSRIKQVLARLLKKVPHGKTSPLPGKTVTRFRDVLSRFPDRPAGMKVGTEEPALIQYTGGTTGTPKGTLLTHRNLVANLVQVMDWIKPDIGHELVLSGFPLFHLAGLALAGVALSMGGAQVLIPNPRDTKHMVNEMAKYKPTIMVNVPSLYMMLLEEPGFRKLDHSRLSFCLSGASPFPVEPIRELERVVGENKVLEVYGLTEASPIITMNPRRGRKKVGTIGIPVAGTQVRLVDLETGTSQVPVGQEGELIACGPQVMRGYLNKPEETAIALREHDGQVWLHTGDVGRMDEDGYFSIVDRTKDMLNVGGFKVFSKEVEEKLYEHQAIEFCAIIGVPNLKRPGSEIVKLVVQTRQSYRNRPEEQLREDILEFARENFSPYKVPKIIEFVDELPLTPVGKVNKKALR